MASDNQEVPFMFKAKPQIIDLEQENVQASKSDRESAGSSSWASVNSQPAHISRNDYTQPEFGKASPLRSKLMSVFNIPKKGAPRPEHHRPAESNNSASRVPSNGSSSQLGNAFKAPPPMAFLDPMSQNQPSQKYAQVPPSAPIFSSIGSNSFKTISVPPSGPVIDLTQRDNNSSDDEFDPNAVLKDKTFGAPDPFEYLDPHMANENLKQLLEGAFEDDEGSEKKRRLPRRVKKPTDSTAKVLEGAKTLAEKLQRLDAKDEKAADNNVAETKPDEEDDDDDGAVDGLNVKLLPHQIEGVSWMIERESGTKKRGVLPKGGILADDMGLGKTVQALSLILTNPRPSKEVLEKIKKKDKKISLDTSTSTLVVAPLALIRQWESEIKTKTPSLKVLVHHGPSRTTSDKKLIANDVVITTYQTLMSENDSGACFRVKWYRVILDEAHSIKNPKAKSTQACYGLDSIYRWCLTGTPMQNNLDELQSLVRFLRIKPYCDYSCWKRDITAPLKNGRGHIAFRRIQVFLKAFMMRRTKDILKKEGAFGHGSASNGEGFKVVGREIKEVQIEFEYNERKFYERLENRAFHSLEDMAHEKNSYFGAFVLLLRLRQACNHSYLMQANMEKDKDALSTGNTNGNRSQSSQKQEDDDLNGLTGMLDGLTVETKKCDVCKTKLSAEEARQGDLRCADCIADLEENLSQEKRKLEEHKQHKSSRSKKQKEERLRLRKERLRRRVVESEDEDEAEWIVSKDKQGKLQGELNTDDEDEEGGGDWIGDDDSETGDEDEADEEEEEKSSSEEADREVHMNFYKPNCFNANSIANLPPSSKITRLLKILKEETPEHKVIVFSQFTSMLDIIEPFLEKKKYRYVRYDGSMRNDQREESLNLLRNNKKTRVLLCSLKCGSLGLNLTAASRVVIMEPFWNPVSLTITFSQDISD
jgi:SNF2 family DNA or RNA helicase